MSKLRLLTEEETRSDRYQFLKRELPTDEWFEYAQRTGADIYAELAPPGATAYFPEDVDEGHLNGPISSVTDILYFRENAASS